VPQQPQRQPRAQPQTAPDAGGRPRFEMSRRHLYLCTPDRDDLEQFVANCIEGGVDVVQLREKDANARRILKQSKLLARVCADHGVPFILNDRPDLALEAGADGVHVGQDDAPVALARRILGDDAVIGLSTHAPSELRESESERTDYISAGPVVATPTKPGRPGTGTSYVSLAVRGSSRPVFVTGGVSPSTVESIAAAGARHFVVVRYLTESDDPRRAAGALRKAVDRVIESSV
jgi:thiamine-phosphate pyrophosphorylase